MGTLLRNGVRRLTGLDELPIDGETGAWVISLAAHLSLLVMLVVLTFPLASQDRVLLSTSPSEEEEVPLEDFQFSDELQQEIGALADASTADAAASAPIEAIESEVVLDIETFSEIGTELAFEVAAPVIEAPQFTDNLLVKGVGAVGATGAQGAVDRITNEILLSLDQRPTLVVWLFDRSFSLRPQREQIAKRFDRVYEELGLLKPEVSAADAEQGEPPLLTAIAAFGERMTLVTPEPTADLPDIQSAVRSITDDPQGSENVFTAIGQLVEKFRYYRLRQPRRNVMLVVFTDEAGDDLPQLDGVVSLCRKLQTPVYVIGVPAPFGRREALVKYVDPQEDPSLPPRFLPVNQGPESIGPERVKLDFLGSRGGRAGDLTLDSGFGPFGLSRLAYETGGIYFAVHPNRRTDRFIRRFDTDAMTTHIAAFFDPRLMRRYRPEYVSLPDYQQFVQRNRARAALVRAAGLSRTNTLERIALVFPKEDEARFARALSFAQRAAAKIEPKINQLVGTLRAGESDRPKLTKPRWQAGYDLAMGRALATKVRAEGYNAMLAQAKQGLKFKNEKNDTWVLRSSDSITTGSVLAKEAKQATAYLERVLTDHADTPWALLARQELSSPLGWEWSEDFRDIAGRRERAAAARNRPRPPTPPRPERSPAPKL